MARLAGVDIDVHWSFSFVILWVIGQGALGNKEVEVILFVLLAVLLLFGCVMLHELGHAWMALRLNVGVKSIVLLPIGGLARLQSLPADPLHELLIAGAGPLVNLAVAVGLIPLLFVFNQEALVTGFMISPLTVMEAVLQSPFQDSAFIELVIFLLLSNVILFLFNLIPAFPLDGGRILRALLAMVFSSVRATQIAVGIGQLLAIALILVALRTRILGLLLMAIFILIAGWPLRIGAPPISLPLDPPDD